MESTLLKVTPMLKNRLEVTFTHLDEQDSYTVDLEENSNTVWKVQYMCEGALQKLIGKVSKITAYEQTGPQRKLSPGVVDMVLRTRSGYKITFDTSDDFSSSSETIDVLNLRSVRAAEYVPAPNPEHRPDKPIIVPPEAFNFIQMIYPECYNTLEKIPNKLITDKTINASSMFNGCNSLLEIPEMNTRNMTAMNAMFFDCYNISTVPMMETYKVTTMNGIFGNCYKLETIPSLDTRNVRSFSRAFLNCSTLISLPELDMSSAVYTDDMFKGCNALEQVSFKKNTLRVDMDFSDCNLSTACVLEIIKNLGKPLGSKARTIVFDHICPDQIDNIDNFKYIFTIEAYNKYIQPALEAGWIFIGIKWEEPTCPALRTDFTRYMSETYPLTYRDMVFVNLPNTSAGTTMLDMFNGCLKLSAIPKELDTQSCYNLAGAFANCISITTLPPLDTSHVVNMTNTCYGCNSLVAVPIMDTSKVTSFKGTFANCLKLNTIAQLDFTSCVDATGMFSRCINLEQLSIKYGTLHCSLDLSNTNLNKQSIFNVLKAAGDINFGNEISFVGVSAAQELSEEEYNIYVKPVMDSGWVVRGIKVPQATVITNFSYYMKNNYPQDYMSMIQAPEIPDTSAAVYATGMYEGCEQMLADNQASWPKLQNADRMFYGCANMIQFYDMLDTKELQSVNSMFYACVRMLTSPAIDTSKVIDFRNMFNSCQMLTEVSELDLSSAKYLDDMFTGCTALKILNIKPDTLHISIDLSGTDLTKENLLNIIFNAGMPKYTNATISFHDVLSQREFTEEDILTYIKPAVDKGWNIDCDVDLPLVRTDFSWYMRNTYPEIYQSFETAPEVDIAMAKFTDHMYDGCTQLKTIPGILDMSNVIHAFAMFKGCPNLEEVHFKEGSIKCNINFSYNNLTKDNVLEIFDRLGDPIDESVAIVFASNIYSLTLDEWNTHVLPAIQKGWKVYGLNQPEDLIIDFTDYLKLTYPDTYRTMEYLTALPDTSAGQIMHRMLAGAGNLKMITADLNTSACTNMRAMFRNDVSLTTIPVLNTDNVTDMSYMFDGCSSLVYIQSELNFNGITEETSQYMFRGCNKLQLMAITPNSLTCDLDLSDTALDISCVVNILKGLPQLPDGVNKTIKFANGTALEGDKYNYVEQAMVKGWNVYGITETPEILPLTDFSYYMRNTYPNDFLTMTECPAIDTSAAIIMQSMFEGCMALESVVPLNTSQVLNMNSMFAGCVHLKTTPELDMTNVSDATLMFANCSALEEVNIKPGTLNTNLDLSDCLSLSKMSIFNIIDNLKAVDAPLTITFPSMSLSFEDYNAHVAPAIAKGWNINGLHRELRTNFNDYMRLYYPDTYQTLSVVNDLESTEAALTMNGMFKGCVNLTVAPIMTTGKVYDMTEMFDGCSKLVSVQSLNMSNVAHTLRMFAGCVNLKMVSFTPGTLKTSLDLSDSPITRQFVINIIKNLSQTPEAGATLTFMPGTQVTGAEWEQYVLPAQQNGWIINGLNIFAGEPGEEPQDPTLTIYASQIITDPDHEFVTAQGKEQLKAFLTEGYEKYNDHMEEFNKHVEEFKQEVEDQDVIEDQLTWGELPSADASIPDVDTQLKNYSMDDSDVDPIIVPNGVNVLKVVVGGIVPSGNTVTYSITADETGKEWVSGELTVGSDVAVSGLDKTIYIGVTPLATYTLRSRIRGTILNGNITIYYSTAINGQTPEVSDLQ